MRLDMIRNEAIRNKIKVIAIQDKIREVRLRWFVHLKKRSVESLVRRCDDSPPIT